MTDEQQPWIDDGHRIEYLVGTEEGLLGNTITNPRLVLVCPGPDKCKAPMRDAKGEAVAGCNLLDWFSSIGGQDFMENNARLEPKTTFSLPRTIEYRWEGWDEEAEPVWRAARV